MVILSLINYYLETNIPRNILIQNNKLRVLFLELYILLRNNTALSTDTNSEGLSFGAIRQCDQKNYKLISVL